MRKRRFIISVVTALVLFTGLTALWLMQPALPPRLEITFAGYTNDAAGKLAAAFTLTNAGGGTISIWNMFTAEAAQPGQPLLASSWAGPPRTLRPGTSGIFLTQSPFPRQSWRMEAIFASVNFRSKWNEWLGSRSGRLVRRIFPISRRGIPIVRVKSDWAPEPPPEKTTAPPPP